jgi:glucosylceramidase
MTFLLTFLFIIQTIALANNPVVAINQKYTIQEIYKTSYKVDSRNPLTEKINTSRGGYQTNNSNQKFDAVININTTTRKQKIWGFGGSITQACIQNIADLEVYEQENVFKTLFNPHIGAGLNFLRIPLGGNDFSTHEYTLDDSDTPDIHLAKMDMSSLDEFILFSKLALKQNPNIHFMVSPWSPPAWMKDNAKLKGGQLLKKYYPSYAIYITKAIEYLEQQGLKIDFLTLLNEPLIGEAKKNWYFQQAYMSAQDQKEFVTKYLLPTLLIRNVNTKILAHDHNWDNASELAFSLAKPTRFSHAVRGVAYHCYGGGMEALKKTLKTHPDHAGFNTECSGQLKENTKSYSYDFQWWMMTQSLDALNEGMAGGLGWNLCLDQKGGPKSEKGCQDCRGLLTIDKNASRNEDRLVKNPELMALAQTSKFVNYGSTRLESTLTEGTGLVPAAFLNTTKQLIVVIRNPEEKLKHIQIQANGIAIGEASVPALGATTVVF